MASHDPILFEHLYRYPCSAAKLYAWHSRPGALQRLLPPWEKTEILENSGSIETGARVVLRMRNGPIPFTYCARHTENRGNEMFRDIQEKGPFKSFSHSHFFSEDGQGSILRDRIELRLPLPGPLASLLEPLVQKKLTRLFAYRSRVLRDDIDLHQRYSKTPLRILISGAGGVLGKELVPLLTTGGHRVHTLVRRRPDPDKNEIFWDPAAAILDGSALPELDAVIHLAGEYIGLSRWSDAKKKRVIDSRVDGTTLLCKTLAALARPPKVLLSASAVGYYGNSGESWQDEDGPVGNDFISQVCSRWEAATWPAREASIRTVLLRLGVGLTPRGGALASLLASSPLGFIRRFGHGRQYISWISSDDMIGAMLHCLVCDKLCGPVNIAAPEPVTNGEFIKILARVAGRPLLFPLAAPILHKLYGQMASEILLSGCRVSTKKLRESGYIFRHPSLETALTLLLGKMESEKTS